MLALVFVEPTFVHRGVLLFLPPFIVRSRYTRGVLLHRMSSWLCVELAEVAVIYGTYFHHLDEASVGGDRLHG